MMRRKKCRSRRELSNEYLLFTCKSNLTIWLRYSRERASERVQKMYALKSILEEELFITNKQSKALIGTLEDEVINEASDG